MTALMGQAYKRGAAADVGAISDYSLLLRLASTRHVVVEEIEKKCRSTSEYKTRPNSRRHSAGRPVAQHQHASIIIAIYMLLRYGEICVLRAAIEQRKLNGGKRETFALSGKSAYQISSHTYRIGVGKSNTREYICAPHARSVKCANVFF